MAIFGSLGKALGLDTPFGMGVLEGFAKQTTKTFEEDKKRIDAQVDRVAEYKIKRQEEESQRIQNEIRENQEKIMGISGKVGGLTGAEYLIRTYGLEEAINKAGQIETLKGFGVTPEFATKDENQTTLDDLTRFTVSAPAVITSGELKDDSTMAKLGLGRDLTEEVQTRIDNAAAQLGTGSFEKPDLGAMPTAKGFDPTDLGMMSDMKDEANRQVRLAISAKDNGDDDAYAKHMASATQMRTMLQTMDTTKLSEAGGRAFKNSISSHIEEASGVNGNYVPDGLGGFRFKANFEKAGDSARVGVASAALTEVYSNAISRGITPATALRAIYEAASENRIPKLVLSDTGSYAIMTGTEVLIEGGLTGGKNAFGMSSAGQTQPNAGASQSSVTQTQSPSGNVNANMSSLIQQHNNATTKAQKDMILGRINRAYGGSQNVPTNITSQLK